MSAVFPQAGPTGPAGPEETPFIHVQSSPSASIVVAHDLNRELVCVTAYDGGGNEVQVGVQVLDSNNVQITTDSGLPFSGKVLVL